MADFTGAAHVDIDVVDLSILLESVKKGISCFLGITKKGESGKPVYVETWLDYQRSFGGDMEGTLFPLIVKRALDAGCPLWVARAAHYTDVDDPSTIEGDKAEVTIGTPSVDEVSFEAKGVGDGYDDIFVSITAPASGNSGVVDITITDNDVPTEPEIWIDFPQVPSNKDIISFNGTAKHINMTVIDGPLPIAESNINGGSWTIANIVALDYVGSQAGMTGIYSFDEVTDAIKIGVPELAEPIVDAALASYCETRKDMRFLVRTPTGLTKDGVVAYRNGTAPYTHAKIDSWYGEMYTGGLRVLSDFDGVETEVSELGDIFGAAAKSDASAGEWFSYGGPNRGRIKNAIGVTTNWGSTSRQSDFNAIDNAGVNAVIVHPTYNVVNWGNSTLQTENTLLKFSNVANLVIFMRRVLKPLYEKFLFEPNAPKTWRAMHRLITPILDDLQTKQAFFEYVYQGDQDVESVNDVKLNKFEDIDRGIYKVKIFFKPIPGIKYIGVELILTNSSVDFGVITEEDI